jgi:hypothetical protein
MSNITRREFEKMATEVVEDFMSGKSIDDSILEKARDMLMNSDQVRRLVEMANTSAFLELFKGKSGDDKMVEFKVADPSEILKKYYSSVPDNSPAKSVVSISVQELDPVSDDSVFFDDIASDKTACGCEDSKYDKSTYDKDDSMFSLEVDPDDEDLKLDKVASFNKAKDPYSKFRAMDIRDSLLTKLAHYDYSTSDLADDVARNYKGIYSRNKHAELELNSLARFGNSAIPFLQMVRGRLGMNKIARPLSQEEYITLADRHIVEDSADLRKVASAIEGIAEFMKITRAIEKVKEVL